MQKAKGKRQNGNSAVRRGWPFLLFTFAFCLLTSDFASALEADELLLIVNKNVPQGRKLAEFYAEKRSVPDHRILELDLPKFEEMPAAAYDREVVPVVRSFLRDNGLERKVSCLVTFYGVPIRVMERVNTQQDVQEQGKLQAELAGMAAQIEPIVQPLEKLAGEGDANFQPQIGKDLDSLGHRAEMAVRYISTRASQSSDPAERERLKRESHKLIEPLLWPIGILERQMIEAAQGARANGSATVPGTQPATQPATQQAAQATTQATTQASTQPTERFVQFRKEMAQLQEQKYDPEAREKLRTLLRENLGPFEYAGLLRSQLAYFVTENTTAALDNELALLWWEYPRSSWLTNPLHYAARIPRS